MYNEGGTDISSDAICGLQATFGKEERILYIGEIVKDSHQTA